MSSRLQGRGDWTEPDRLFRWLVPVALVVGALLRLVLPSDIVYLGDEADMFERVHAFERSGVWPLYGMASSQGVKNPGFSVWVFIALSKVFSSASPVTLTRGVSVLALLAHASLLVVPRFVDDPRDKNAWRWAFVLSVTNPILVFLERKLWAQSVLPIFMVVLLIGYLRRDRWWGAFAWGLVGAIVGQIHMAGFFFVPALFAWTMLFGRAKKTKLASFIGGSALGALPLLPWVVYLAHDRPAASSRRFALIFRLEFYQYFWSDLSGLCSAYTVGGDAWALLRYPVVFGVPTYASLVAHVALALASTWIAICAILRARAIVRAGLDRPAVRALLGASGSDTRLLFGAVLVPMGLLMTLPALSIHRHYMLAIFPIQYLWAAFVAGDTRRGRGALVVLFAGYVVVCASVLSLVHDRGGAKEFGPTYRRQLVERLPPAVPASAP